MSDLSPVELIGAHQQQALPEGISVGDPRALPLSQNVSDGRQRPNDLTLLLVPLS